MAVKKPALTRFDRVRRPDDTKATATLIDIHKEGALGVLLDEGPKQLTMWPKAIRVSGPIRTCTRCPDTSTAQGHTAIYCKENL